MQKISVSAAIRQATANHRPVTKYGRSSYSYTRRDNPAAPGVRMSHPNMREVQAHRRASIAAAAAKLLGLSAPELAYESARAGATIREALDYLAARDALEQLRKAAHPLDVNTARCALGPRRLPAYTVSGYPGVFTAEGVRLIAQGIDPGQGMCKVYA